MRRENEFLYSKLANILREQITSGFIKPGEFLLSEVDLASYYNLSRVSVRKSLDILVSEGMIVKKVGQGNMVPYDLNLQKSSLKPFNVVAISPSHFVDSCMPYIIEAFKQQHPNLQVNVLNVPGGEKFWELLNHFESSGYSADVLFVTDNLLKGMGYEGSFLDMSSHMRNALDAVYPSLLRTFGEGDAVKAVPVTFSTVFPVYNPELFQKYDVSEPTENWTWQDFIKAAGQLTRDTDGDGVVDLYGLSFTSSITRWLVFMLSNGVDFFSVKENPGPLTQTLNTIHDLLYRLKIAKIYPRFCTNNGPFFHGKSAMTLTSSMELEGWKNAGLTFEPKIAPIAFGESDSTLLIVNAFMIPSKAASPDTSCAFIRTALSEAVQEAIVTRNHFLSVIPDINKKLLDGIHLKSLGIHGNALESGKCLYDIFPDPNITLELEAELELFFHGLESVSSVLPRIQSIFAG